MTRRDKKYVHCAHCGVQVRLEEAVHYKHRLIYSEHYHCQECDPDSAWDCMSHDVDLDVH